jgi:D-cysteine desulfhydrase
VSDQLPHADINKRLESYPRSPLGTFPSPLEYLPRISEIHSREIFIKRDDNLGPGLGGNKTRKLEYLLADACKHGHKKVATFGGLGSNHTRITSAAARKYGLTPHLFFFEARPSRFRGNLLINSYLGAKMHFLPIGSGSGMRLETSITMVRWLARLWIGRHYFIPVGGHSPLGGLGYVRAALEIDNQVSELGINNPHLILAAGTGGTLAGLLAGLRFINSPINLLGIDVGKLWKGFPDSIAHLANSICHLLGCSAQFSPDQVPLIEGRYVGPGYAQPTTRGMQTLGIMASLEGILLDPVYTAKAFAGMLDLVATGTLPSNGSLIFLHTGGLPGIFAFDEDTYCVE